MRTVDAIALADAPDLSARLDPLTFSLLTLAGLSVLFAMYVAQQQRLAALERVSVLDPLTGLVCGRYFDAERWPARLRSSSPLAVLYVDLDGLKRNNDCFGHSAGDRFIVRAAEALRACVRRGVDDVVRLHAAGDEFLIVLACPSRERAERIGALVLDRLRAASISASVGVAFSSSTDPGERAALRERAEASMYAAKRLGRGRCILAEDPGPAHAETRTLSLSIQGREREAIPEAIEDPTGRYAVQRTQPYPLETAARLTAACGGT